MRDWLENLKQRQARQAELEAMQPIERNAILLADLEREWSVLGPLRPITYTIYVGDNEQQARAFEIETTTLGFDTSLTCGEFGGQWSVHATRSIEPTAENIKNGKYPYIVNVYLVTREDVKNPNLDSLINWLLSAQGQEMIESIGYVGVK